MCTTILLLLNFLFFDMKDISPEYPYTECPSIDPDKDQILLVVVGSLRSLIFPSNQDLYFRNIVQSLQNNSNAQIHQIWYFSLGDASSWGDVKQSSPFPKATMSDLQLMQAHNNVPLLEVYNASQLVYPDFVFSHNYRNCTGTDMHLPDGVYAQTYHLQSAINLALTYSDKCRVNWKYLVKSRPDWVCDLPLPLNLRLYDNHTEAVIIFDDNWRFPIGDQFYAMNKATTQKLFSDILYMHVNLPCEATPPGFYNSESYLRTLLIHHDIQMIGSSMNMCELKRLEAKGG